MTPAEVLMALALGVWLLLTPVAHVPYRACRRLRQMDRAGLLPHWNFFAPNPAVIDIHLVFQFATPTPGPWVEYPIAARHRWSPLFHSDRRRRKAIVDLGGQLGSDAASNPHAVRVSVPYVLFLDMSQSLAPPHAVASRFALLSFPADDDDPEIVFLSDFHPLM